METRKVRSDLDGHMSVTGVELRRRAEQALSSERLVDRLAVSTDEAAVLLGSSRSQVWRLLRSGQLPSFLIGQRVRRIRVEALRQFMEQQEHSGSYGLGSPD